MSSSRSKGSSKVKMQIILIKFYTKSNKLIFRLVCVFWLKESVLIVIWLSKVTYKVKTQIYTDRHVYGKYVCIWNWDMDQREQLAWLSIKDRWLNGPQSLRYAVSSQLMSISLVLWYLLKYKSTTMKRLNQGHRLTTKTGPAFNKLWHEQSVTLVVDF